MDPIQAAEVALRSEAQNRCGPGKRPSLSQCCKRGNCVQGRCAPIKRPEAEVARFGLCDSAPALSARPQAFLCPAPPREDAAIDDGKLDLYLIYPCRLWQLATSLIHLKFGISEPAVLKRLTAVSVSLRTYRPRPVDADGELVTKTPTQFELHPKALTEIVPHKRPLDSSI